MIHVRIHLNLPSQSKAFAEVRSSVLAVLKEKTVNDANGRHFNFGGNNIDDQYYGIVLGRILNFKFKGVEKWAKYVASQQDASVGGVLVTCAHS